MLKDDINKALEEFYDHGGTAGDIKRATGLTYAAIRRTRTGCSYMDTVERIAAALGKKVVLVDK